MRHRKLRISTLLEIHMFCNEFHQEGVGFNNANEMLIWQATRFLLHELKETWKPIVCKCSWPGDSLFKRRSLDLQLHPLFLCLLVLPDQLVKFLISQVIDQVMTKESNGNHLLSKDVVQ